MTQKHFIAIADAIRLQVLDWKEHLSPYPSTRDHRAEAALMVLESTAKNLADYFQTINPNFKRDKFLTACGL